MHKLRPVSGLSFRALKRDQADYLIADCLVFLFADCFVLLFE